MIGGFSAAERYQSKLLFELSNSIDTKETQAPEKLAKGLVDLFSSFLEKETGRGNFNTLLAKVSILYHAMAIDVAPLNRALLRRHFFGVQLPNENTLLHLAADQNALNLAKSLVRRVADIKHSDSVEERRWQMRHSEEFPLWGVFGSRIKRGLMCMMMIEIQRFTKHKTLSVT